MADTLPIPAATVGPSTTAVGTPTLTNAQDIVTPEGIAPLAFRGAGLVYTAGSPGIGVFQFSTVDPQDWNFVFGEGPRTQLIMGVTLVHVKELQ